MTSKVGDRVFAVLKVAEEDGEQVLHYFGEGTYLGDSSENDFGITNPKIQLDNGRIIWGYQCWWGPLDRLENFKSRYKVKKVVMVAEGADV